MAEQTRNTWMPSAQRRLAPLHVGRQIARAARGSAHHLVALTLFAMIGATAPANAQYGGSFITSFPPNDTYRVYVIGDSIAEGLSVGLKSELEADGGVNVQVKTAWGVGLTRNRPFNLIDRVGDYAKGDDFQVVVLAIGSSDRRSMRVEGQRYSPGEPSWLQEYGRRMDALLDIFAREKAAVYVVGLPVMADAARNADMQLVNGVLRERAFRKGMRFIDTFAGFADANGAYNAYGPDLEGKVRRLRDKDGVHFTGSGYRKLAHFVVKEIARDLAQARAQRDIPLAGDADEQQRVLERRALLLEAKRFAAEGPRAASEDTGDTAGTAFGPLVPAGGALEYKDDTSRITLPSASGLGALVATGNLTSARQDVEIELVRPAIPSAVVAHIQRRSKSRSGTSAADPLPVDLASGETVLSQVTPEQEWLDTGNRRRLPVTQTPYYKVLVKGERLTPKRNRADDFVWPPRGVSTRDAAQGPGGNAGSG